MRRRKIKKTEKKKKTHLLLSLPLLSNPLKPLQLQQLQAAEATTKALDVAGDYAGKAKDAASDAAHAATEKAKEVAAKVDAAIH